MSQITINLLYKGQHSKAENLDIWLLNLQTRVDKLEKNELVAIFSCENSSNIKPELHYIRHSETPNCYLDKKRVFTKECVQELTELTLTEFIIRPRPLAEPEDGWLNNLITNILK